MVTGKKKCKICGKDYDYCRPNGLTLNVFRWQDVACSPEHGTIYFEQIAKSRNTEEDIKDEKGVATKSVVSQKDDDFLADAESDIDTSKLSVNPLKKKRNK